MEFSGRNLKQRRSRPKSEPTAWPEYTSLRDILESSDDGRPLTCSSIDIAIKNPLVRRAACLYLQAVPTPTPRRPPDGSSSNCLVCKACRRLPEELKQFPWPWLGLIQSHLVGKLRG